MNSFGAAGQIIIIITCTTTTMATVIIVIDSYFIPNRDHLSVNLTHAGFAQLVIRSEVPAVHAYSHYLLQTE